LKKKIQNKNKNHGGGAVQPGFCKRVWECGCDCFLKCFLFENALK
jgi:hypothetical protein